MMMFLVIISNDGIYYYCHVLLHLCCTSSPTIQHFLLLNLTNYLMSVQTNKPEKTENLVRPICHNSDGTKANTFTIYNMCSEPERHLNVEL